MEIDKLCPGCMNTVEEKERIAVCPHCGYDLKNAKSAPHQLQPFSILNGKYLIGKVLGSGGFGITYLGLDLVLEILVAIKEFYPNGFVTRDATVDPEVAIFAGNNTQDVEKWRDNFLKEARSLGRCNNLPGIVKVQEFFVENNTAYIVMEYIDGITMKSYLKQNEGKMPADTVFRLMEPMIRSLQQVHETGIIHRDISPDNIMITRQGSIKLLDFGAAREVSVGVEKSISVMLKHGYAPEEQYRTRGKQGAWTDVYALCATIYKCLTGAAPVEAMERLRDDSLKMPSAMGIKIPADKEAALRKGLAIYAEERFQSMSELHRALYEGENAYLPGQKEEVRSAAQHAGRQGAVKQTAAPSKNAFLVVGIAVLCMISCAIFFWVRGKGMLQDGKEAESQATDALTMAGGRGEDEGEESEDDALGRKEESPDSEEVPETFEEAQAEKAAVEMEMQRELSALNERAQEAERQKDALTMAEILSDYCDFALNYHAAEMIGEQLQAYYAQYREYLLAQHDFYYGLDVSVLLYIQMSGDLDTAISIADRLNSLGILVDGSTFADRRQQLTESYRLLLADTFDAQANNDIAQNGVVSRTTLWKLMENVPDTDLMDIEDPEDPITRRYSLALALHIDSELDSLDSTQAILRIYDELEDTDYNLLLVYYLAHRYGDVRAAEWMNYIDQNIVYNFSAFDVAAMKNFTVKFYTNLEYVYSRQSLRDYMGAHFSRP
ncbi:MAG: serine/threonine protein kinase [Lachnospiraceae bacterium]|nr:serine/threonine protein kinase [Lachnospiraceae bacterium]